MASYILTQEELKSNLHYDSETGIFTRKISRHPKYKIGGIAGCLHNCGYLRISINKKSYLAHRLAWLYMTGEFPLSGIDHINNDPLDNRFYNLREANKSENGQNRSKNKNNKSGFKGVCFDNNRGKWVAQIMANGKRKFLGYFETAELAAIKYEEFAIKLHGKFFMI